MAAAIEGDDMPKSVMPNKDQKRTSKRDAETKTSKKAEVLSEADLANISGGLNPQPLPPDRRNTRDS